MRKMFLIVCAFALMTVQAHETDSLQVQMDSMYYKLQELTVTAQKSLIKLENGNISADIPALTRGTGVNNAYEALVYVPGLSFIGEELKMFGTSSVTVLLNGKNIGVGWSQMVQILRSIPVGRVERVELIYAASPETGVKGPVVNIVLQTLTSNVLQGNILAEVSYAREWSSGVGASLLCNYNSWQIEGNIMSDFVNRTRNGNEMNMWHEVNSKELHLWQDYETVAEEPNLNAYISTTYNFDKDKYLRMRYYHDNTWRKSNGYSLFENISIGEKENVAITTQRPERLDYVDMDLSLPEVLNMNVMYVNSRFSSKSEMGDVYAMSENKVNTLSFRLSRNCDRLGRVTIPYGINGSYSRNAATGVLQKEVTAGVFAGAEYACDDRFNVSVYIKGELYARKEMISNEKTSRYDIYPQVSMSYMPNAQHILQLTVSSDKVYPTFSEQTNSERFINRYIRVVGNPGLMPSREYTSVLASLLSH